MEWSHRLIGATRPIPPGLIGATRPIPSEVAPDRFLFLISPNYMKKESAKGIGRVAPI
jgi:hypothetical protein